MFPLHSISIKMLGMCSKTVANESFQGFRMRAVVAALISTGAFVLVRSWVREARTTSNSRKVVPMAFSRPSMI
jgi:hypothetical protein